MGIQTNRIPRSENLYLSYFQCLAKIDRVALCNHALLLKQEDKLLASNFPMLSPRGN